MNFVITLLTILEVIVCLLLSLLVLMQRPRQEGLGAAFGSGVTDQMFGAQTTNVLQKATVYFGVALFGLTFLLAILISRQDDRATGRSTFVEPTDKVAAPVAPAVPTAAVPAPPAAPAKVDQTAPATGTPAVPTGSKPAESKPAQSNPAENKIPAPAAPAADKPGTPAPVPAPGSASPAPPAPAPIPKPTTSAPAK
jgi:preprotein translocase subunit SecG